VDLWLFLSVICHKTEEDMATRITFADARRYQERFLEIVDELFGEFNKNGPVGIKNKVEGLRKALPDHWVK
jgi:hypothetical protein